MTAEAGPAAHASKEKAGAKVLVCGGRDLTDRESVNRVLDGIHDCGYIFGFGPVRLLIHGAARGADTIAGEWAASRGLLQRWWKADWNKHKKGAGPIRNQKMLDEGKPDLVVAFPGGRGTADMVRRARAAGVPVIEIVLEETK